MEETAMADDPCPTMQDALAPLYQERTDLQAELHPG
jgi:hypothetical protein